MLPVFKRIIVFSKGFRKIRWVWVLREIFCVSFVFYYRYERRLWGSAHDVLPAEILNEPLVVFYILYSSCHTAHSLSCIANKKMLHKALCLLVEVPRKFDFSFKNFLVYCHRIIVIEWINSSKHFISEDPEAPPINRFSMPFVCKYFWREILRCSTESKCPSFYYFSESKISKK